jgi:hypothetical protein
VTKDQQRPLAEVLHDLRLALEAHGDHLKPSGSVLALLAEVWPSLEGASESKMGAGKLDRIEQICWSAPILTFRSNVMVGQFVAA